MSLFAYLARKLHPATVHTVPNAGPTRAVPAMGRARVPLNAMPRLGEVDGDTVAFPTTGAALNRGSGYRSRRPVDYNRLPERLTRQQVA